MKWWPTKEDRELWNSIIKKHKEEKEKLKDQLIEKIYTNNYFIFRYLFYVGKEGLFEGFVGICTIIGILFFLGMVGLKIYFTGV